MMRRLAIGLFFAAMTAAASATEGAMEGATLRFDFYYGGMKIADMTEILRFSPDGKRYTLDSVAEAVGLAKMLHGDVVIGSAGTVDAEAGLLMTAYAEKRGDRRARQSAERDGDILRLRRGDETREESVLSPVFDHLSAVYRSYALGAARGGTIAVTNGWRLGEYVYVVGEEETISTGLGDIRAVPITRQSERGERKAWLAPAFGYLPARLYVDDKGHVFEMVVKEIVAPTVENARNGEAARSLGGD